MIRTKGIGAPLHSMGRRSRFQDRVAVLDEGGQRLWIAKLGT
jgi:hypothetical protein